MDSEIENRLSWILNRIKTPSDRIMSFYQNPDLVIEKKNDLSFVTEADRSTELLLKDLILNKFDEDSFIGEEFGTHNLGKDYGWVVDPIDGTQSFVSGVPFFGILIGILHQNQPKAGLIHFPALDETIYAQINKGSWWRASGKKSFTQTFCSSVGDISQAKLSVTSVKDFEKSHKKIFWSKISQDVNKIFGWGDCYGYSLLARGQIEIMTDAYLNLWDAAALFPIVKESGGFFMDLDGNETISGGNGLACNSALKEKLLKYR